MQLIDFKKQNGLVPAVVQESGSGVVLMLGYMNEAALQKTIETNNVTFWSRTRNQLWTKGETSGNILRVESIFTDCDADSLMIRAQIEGDGVCCHTGEHSCFHVTLGDERVKG